MKLKKAEIVEKIAAKMGGTNKEAEAAMDAVVDTMKEVLSAGDTFAWPGFATFSVKDIPAKSGTAPNGETWSKPACKGVKFKAAPALKESVN